MVALWLTPAVIHIIDASLHSSYVPNLIFEEELVSGIQFSKSKASPSAFCILMSINTISCIFIFELKSE